MPLIVTDRVAWSVGLYLGPSPSEPCKNGWSDWYAVCVDDSGDPKETRITYNEPLRAEYCIVFIRHNPAI